MDQQRAGRDQTEREEEAITQRVWREVGWACKSGLPEREKELEERPRARNGRLQARRTGQSGGGKGWEGRRDGKGTGLKGRAREMLQGGNPCASVIGSNRLRRSGGNQGWLERDHATGKSRGRARIHRKVQREGRQTGS